uniref:Uncharacterized protein n=1 Tax=Romanomermis culicivorax TaxID=13658 RepID=A0A915KW72_ROMCU
MASHMIVIGAPILLIGECQQIIDSRSPCWLKNTIIRSKKIWLIARFKGFVHCFQAKIYAKSTLHLPQPLIFKTCACLPGNVRVKLAALRPPSVTISTYWMTYDLLNDDAPKAKLAATICGRSCRPRSKIKRPRCVQSVERLSIWIFVRGFLAFSKG